MTKVLVIDDDEPVCRLICRILAANGYECIEARDGEEGLEVLIHTRVAIVVVDPVMPRRGGADVIQRIRRMDPSLPIIAISGALGDEKHAPLTEARTVGADLALAKPFTSENLLAAVSEVLDRRNA